MENIEKPKLFKNKTQMIFYIILFIVFIVGFIYFGTKDYSNNTITDNEKFVSEHKNVDINNVYTYINGSDAYTYIKNDNVLLLFGTRNSEYVSYYANIINDVAKEIGIEKIFYYDILDDRENSNATYDSIVVYLKDYVTYLDSGKANIYGPTFIVKKDGEIIYYDDETAIMKGNVKAKEYWDDSKVSMKKDELRAAFQTYRGIEEENGE